MKIDVVAGEAHFIDHLAPVYRALPDELRGDFIVAPNRTRASSLPGLLARAGSRGVTATTIVADRSRPVLVASYGDMRRAPRRRVARMEHGYGQSYAGSRHPSYAGGTGAQDVGLFLTPNEHAAARWRTFYPRARVEVVGCPKLDELPDRQNGTGPVIATSFHWGTALPKSTLLNESYGSWIEYRRAVLELATAHQLIGHGHPKLLPTIAPDYEAASIEVVPDFADVCRRADLYVVDTSSTLFEFASTGRPVVVINGRHFRRDVVHGLRFWEAAGVGIQCDAPAELAAVVEAALLDPPHQRAARDAALDIVYAHRTGSAAFAAAALVDWATAPLTSGRRRL